MAAAITDKSIAVLPFENLSAEKENAFFADGVQNEILSDLAKIADLKVISRASVIIYKAGSARNLREIGQQLGVAHVLEGSVQRAGSKVRVNAQLIDARVDKHLWAGTYDRDLADVFAIETELAQAIAGELQARLTTSEKASIEEKPTQDLVAYDLYVRAVSLIYNAQVPSQANLVDRSEAVELLNKAVARDPNFLLAYCQLAFLHDLIYQQEIDHTPARLALAKSAIESAFRLKPDSGEAHLALGWHVYWGYFDYDRARAEVALAQKSLPNNPRVYELAGLIDRHDRRWAEATHNLERAGELDPRNIPYLITLATTYRWLLDYDQMARVLDHIISLVPDRNKPRIIRAGIEVDRRADTGPLRAAIETALANEPGSAEDPFMAGQRLELALLDRDLDAAGSLAAALPLKQMLDAGFTEGSRDFWLAVVARLKGDVAAARAAFVRMRADLEEVMRVHPDDIHLLSDLGLIDAALGRKEEALREGRRAVEQVPNAQEAMFGSYNNEGRTRARFAMICAWVGERELALEQLETVTKSPGGPSYGELRLNPMWDPLRGDPRFEKIVASLAPKDAKP
jgi:TolB-like protein/Tfp pilus assembly protein PilF